MDRDSALRRAEFGWPAPGVGDTVVVYRSGASWGRYKPAGTGTVQSVDRAARTVWLDVDWLASVPDTPAWPAPRGGVLRRAVSRLVGFDRMEWRMATLEESHAAPTPETWEQVLLNALRGVWLPGSPADAERMGGE